MVLPSRHFHITGHGSCDYVTKLRCHYWQNEEEGAGSEDKRVLFGNNQGK